MVELRKRKADTEAAPPPVKKANSAKSASGSKKADSVSSKLAEGQKVGISILHHIQIISVPISSDCLVKFQFSIRCSGLCL